MCVFAFAKLPPRQEKHSEISFSKGPGLPMGGFFCAWISRVSTIYPPLSLSLSLLHSEVVLVLDLS